MFSNEHATLTHYKDSLKGKGQDYKIHFKHTQHSTDEIVHLSSGIVKYLIDKFHNDDLTILGRLVARVTYTRVITGEKATYYRPSYQAEVIEDAANFFHGGLRI